MNTLSTTVSERCLRFLLRYLGIVCLLAIGAVCMPYQWMNRIHQSLGMGLLPSEPIVGYLARSLSFFYAVMGGLMLLCSFDLHRHKRVLCYFGAAFILFGAVVWGVDYIEGMPVYWKRFEGPFVIVVGVAILFLALRLKEPGDRRLS
jgi:hypothetical protein